MDVRSKLRDKGVHGLVIASLDEVACEYILYKSVKLL